MLIFWGAEALGVRLPEAVVPLCVVTQLDGTMTPAREMGHGLPLGAVEKSPPAECIREESMGATGYGTDAQLSGERRFIRPMVPGDAWQGVVCTEASTGRETDGPNVNSLLESPKSYRTIRRA
jgi:hypothetical protein